MPISNPAAAGSEGWVSLATVKVLDGGVATSWTGINCQSIVGSGKCLIDAAIIQRDTSTSVYIRGRNDEEDDPPAMPLVNGGIARRVIASANGYIFYKILSPGANGIDVHLDAYIKVT